MSTSSRKIPAWFDQFRAEAALILQGIEQMHPLVCSKRPLREQPGWGELKSRPWFDVGSVPWLVATLFGPTGSGKSTLFRLLTGLPVPAGDRVRPITFHPLVAIPNELVETGPPTGLFPSHQLKHLRNFQELQKKEQDDPEVLFYTDYDDFDPQAPLRLILADVPDFDTVYRENWTKAEDMMRRAEMVLFTVYPASYLDHSVVSRLQECCAHAGKLALFINKTESHRQAQLIWEDLQRKLRSQAAGLTEWSAQRRSDGRSLGDFLRQSPVYYSLRSDHLELDAIRPLQPGTPPLRSLLQGLDGIEVLWASLKEDAWKAVGSCRDLCQQTEQSAARWVADIETAHQTLEETASIVAGTCFPAGKLNALILKVAREYRPGWLKIVGHPMAWVSSLASHSRRSLRRLLHGRTRPMEQLEHQRLDQLLDRLLDKLRTDLPRAKLTMEQCRRARDRSAARQIPPPATDWEATVQQAARQWAETHRWKTTLLASLNDLLLLIGGTAFGVDLMVTGGQSSLWGGLLLSKLGIVGAAGAGSAAAGALLRFYETLGLRKTLEVADAAWRDQRGREIFHHLRRHLVGPLFLETWENRLQELNRVPLDRYRQACDQLERFLHHKS